MKITISVLVNKDGDHVASHDADLLDELFEEHVGGSLVGLRTLKIELEIPDPKPVVVRGVVPAIAAGEIEMSVTEQV